MMPREFIAVAAGNLWRMKLRSSLTIAGITVAVGALVTMLAFASGVQRNVAAQFRELGLFQTLHVMPAGGPGAGMLDGRVPAASDTTASAERVPLDDDAIARIAAIDGVALVYPQETFDAQLVWSGHEHSATAQVLPALYAQRRNPGRLIAGRFYTRDNAREVVISERMRAAIGVPADSLLGRKIKVRTAGLSQLAYGVMVEFLRQFDLPPEIARLIREASAAFPVLLGRGEIELTVCGIAELQSGFGFRVHDLLVPPVTARSLDRLSFSDPFELMAQLNSLGSRGYPLAVVTLADVKDHDRVRTAIEALGLRVMSFSDTFREMRKQFLLFDLVVAVLGFIAIFVAALGIVNTMVMSIVERTREIGVLKALGAQDGQVRLLFLVESARLGLIGSLGGLALGWAVSRAGAFIIRRILIARDVPQMDMFHLPAGIALGAIAFGVGVSLLAGVYPAARAARIDPVRALRHE
jgi:putative ABC transport system permease protein